MKFAFKLCRYSFIINTKMCLQYVIRWSDIRLTIFSFLKNVQNYWKLFYTVKSLLCHFITDYRPWRELSPSLYSFRRLPSLLNHVSKCRFVIFDPIYFPCPIWKASKTQYNHIFRFSFPFFVHHNSSFFPFILFSLLFPSFSSLFPPFLPFLPLLLKSFPNSLQYWTLYTPSIVLYYTLLSVLNMYVRCLFRKWT